MHRLIICIISYGPAATLHEKVTNLTVKVCLDLFGLEKETASMIRIRKHVRKCAVLQAGLKNADPPVLQNGRIDRRILLPNRFVLANMSAEKLTARTRKLTDLRPLRVAPTQNIVTVPQTGILVIGERNRWSQHGCWSNSLRKVNWRCHDSWCNTCVNRRRRTRIEGSNIN